MSNRIVFVGVLSMRAAVSTCRGLMAAIVPLTLIVAAVLVPARVSAQGATATLTGVTVDESGAAVPDVEIVILNTATQQRRQTTTSSEGTFVVPLLPPGRYSVNARRDGFAPTEIPSVVLNVNDQIALRVQLKVSTLDEQVTVQADTPRLNTSPAVATVVDRKFVENMPLNGRSFQSLIALTPGVTLTRASQGGEQGQFSVNGQRGNANYFTVDGVGANFGISPHGNPVGQGGGGSLPAFGASGGTGNLVSVDALEEFKIQTSTYAPEFGRTPGGQIQIVTRSGTNTLHGTAFNYLRNDQFDASDWFANRNGLAKPQLRQNDFGGVIGGPVIANHTFFFGSYEGLRLRQPQVGITDVPSLSFREAVPAGLRPFLNAFPVPNGPDTTNGMARFSASFSNPSNLDATSVRIDHTLRPDMTVFGRYNHAASDLGQHGFGGFTPLSNTLFAETRTRTLTLGTTWAISPRMSHDLRVNYSSSFSVLGLDTDTFGGATPLEFALPSPFTLNDSVLAISFPGTSAGSLQVGRLGGNTQRQLNIVDTFILSLGAHQIKMGGDYRRLAPDLNVQQYQVSMSGLDYARALAGIAMNASVTRNHEGIDLTFHNLSLYAQDAWTMTDRLTLTYGLRWELNPPPAVEASMQPFPLVNVDNVAQLRFGRQGDPLWKTTYGNLAPRAGLAYQLSNAPGRETVLRGGVGVFYDLGNSTAGNLASQNAFPYASTRNYVEVPVPLSAALAAAPPLSLDPPYSAIVYGIDPALELPRTMHWNVSVERALGRHQTLTTSYVGASGRRLIRQEILNNVNADFNTARIAKNSGESDYRALQVQLQRRLSSGLQALGSYAWARSMDTGSNDSLAVQGTHRIDLSQERGPSDFDIRHVVTAAATYDIPRVVRSGIGAALLGDWSLDAIFRYQSAGPFDVTSSRNFGAYNASLRPDVVPGVPFYLDDPAAPGGLRLNRDAFVIPTEQRQGNLPRNALRGFAAHQLDVALRRQFRLSGRVGLHVRFEVFNALNHPNFADPARSLTSSTFGLSATMLGRSLGEGGGFGGGFSPLYQFGGPRSSQLSVKLQF